MIAYPSDQKVHSSISIKIKSKKSLFGCKTKKVKIIIGLLLLLFTNKAIGQNRKFKLWETNPIESNIDVKNFHTKSSFIFDDHTYLIGEYGYGIKMIIFSQGKNKIFEFQGSGDEYYMRPYFFKTNLPEDGTIVLLAIGFEECSSSAVFHIKDKSIKGLGHLNICAVIDGDTLNVEKYITISISRDELNFSFDMNEVYGYDSQLHKLEILYYDQDGEEQLMDASKVSYKYLNGKLERIIE